MADKPLYLLFIGNSFTGRNDVPGLLARIAASADPPTVIESRSLLMSGMPLRAHWNKGEAAQAIRDRSWDYVVLQEQSTMPLKNAARMHESVRLFDTAIRDAGSRLALYMTWSRAGEPDRQEELSAAYEAIGRELDALVVPAGRAWKRIRESRPEIILHDADGSHPTLAGSYLSACTFYATLFRLSPVGLWSPDALREVAPTLQDAAGQVAIQT